MAVALHLLRTEQDPHFEAVADLYRTAFPASERKPVAFLAAAIRRNDYALYAAMTQAAPIGLAITYRGQGGDFILLEYMAIAPCERGKGLGGQVFRALAEQCMPPMLLEVESERPDMPGAEERRRRLDFYRRLGCRRIAGLDYRMPRLGGAAPPPPMVLMLHGARAPSATRLRRWLIEIYRNVYDRPAEDSRLVKMLGQINAEVQLT